MGKTKQKRKFRFRRFALKLLCTVLGLLLAGMLAVTLYAHALVNRLPGTQTDDPSGLAGLLTGPGGLLEGKEEPVLLPGSKDTIHILLIGQDRHTGGEQARSDSMILCSFDPNAKTLTMTSILRDLYVTIPGYQDNRINAAYAFGGVPLLLRTLEENLGLQVDGTVEVDFDQFTGIVDIIGGVTMELRADEASLINERTGSSLTEGANRLTGELALEYARIRSLDGDGDFSRTNRQRKVIQAILQEYRSADWKTVLVTLQEVLPMITTDMGTVKLMRYGLTLFPMLSDMTIVSQRIPADGTYSGQMIRGMSVLVADMDANRALIEDLLS